MAFFPVLCVHSFLVSYDDYENYVSTYYDYRVLNNCYERRNELFVNLDANQICINLFPLGDPNCKEIPRGVYIDFDFSNFNNYVLRLQVEDFDYETTTQVCGGCLNQQNQSSCLFLQQTNSAKALIHSLTREVELVVGKMSIQHADLSNCYSIGESVFYFSQEKAEFAVYENGNCVNVLSTCGQTRFSELKLDIYDESKPIESKNFLNFTTTLEEKDGVQIKRVTIIDDFSKLMTTSFDEVRVDMYIDCGMFNNTPIQARVMTTISLVQSFFYPQVFGSLQVTVNPEKIDLNHEKIESLSSMGDYLAGVNKVEVVIRFFNITSGVYIHRVEFTAPSFDLDKDDDKVYKCSQTTDTNKCITDLQELLLKDFTEVAILIQVYLFQDSAMKVFLSHYEEEILKSCWTQSQLVYHNDRVCAVLTQYNDPSCPFVQPKSVSVLFHFYKPNYTETMDFSVELQYSIEDNICIVCSEEPDEAACLKALPNLFKQGMYVDLSVTSLDDDASRETIIIISSYNSDYTSLYSIVKILGIVVGCAMVGLIGFSVVTDLGVCKTKKKQKVAVREMDDI